MPKVGFYLTAKGSSNAIHAFQNCRHHFTTNISFSASTPKICKNWQCMTSKVLLHCFLVQYSSENYQCRRALQKFCMKACSFINPIRMARNPTRWHGKSFTLYFKGVYEYVNSISSIKPENSATRH